MKMNKGLPWLTPLFFQGRLRESEGITVPSVHATSGSFIQLGCWNVHNLLEAFALATSSGSEPATERIWIDPGVSWCELALSPLLHQNALFCQLSSDLL